MDLVAERSFAVMCVKMLHSVPESDRLRFVSEQDWLGMTLLHRVASSGNIETIKAILDVYPESDRLQV